MNGAWRIVRLALAGWGIAAFAAFGGCGAPPEVFVDPELRVANHAARRAFDIGDLDSALVFYRTALTRARGMDAAMDIGTAAYNLAACLLELSREEEAAPWLDVAESALRRAGEPLADVLVLRAETLLAAGDPGAAVRELQRIETDPAAQPAPEHQLVAETIRGRCALQRGDVAAGAKHLAAARKLAGFPADPADRERSAAHVAVSALAIRVSLATDRPREAAELADRLVDVLRDQRRYHAMTTTLEQAGDAWRAAGEAPMAADRYSRAGHALRARGDEAHATELFQRAQVARRDGK